MISKSGGVEPPLPKFRGGCDPPTPPPPPLFGARVYNAQSTPSYLCYIFLLGHPMLFIHVMYITIHGLKTRTRSLLHDWQTRFPWHRLYSCTAYHPVRKTIRVYNNRGRSTYSYRSSSWIIVTIQENIMHWRIEGGGQGGLGPPLNLVKV